MIDELNGENRGQTEGTLHYSAGCRYAEIVMNRETESGRQTDRVGDRDQTMLISFHRARTHLIGALAERNQIGKQAVHERHRLETERHAVPALVERALEREEVGVGAGRAELRQCWQMGEGRGQEAEGRWQIAGCRGKRCRGQRAEGREQSIICGT
jgi:hypothetical protein